MPHRAPVPEPPDHEAAHLALVQGFMQALRERRPGVEVLRARTHISTLVFAGDEAWKFKRPVHLPFVDFSSRAQRHAACLKELRLNRRTAPALYLGVVPVGRADDGGPADWAVHMRRFDEAQRLDHRARAGTLGPAEIDALAAEVARFHAALPPAPGWGAPHDVRRWARDNLAELRALAGAPAQAMLQALAHWTEAEGERLAPRMQARRDAGWVREGHGDLHLANIVWHDGLPVLFDALEFHDGWRHLDTLADLAFTFMDLQALGLPRMAWRFMSQVLQASGDFDGLALLPWHAVYRALVRAKVAALSPPAGPQEAAPVDYIGLALRLAGLGAAPARPRLLLACGLSGSGKSTVAAWMAERLGTVRVRSDVERKRLFGLAATDRAPAGVDLYTPEATQRTYARMYAVARDAIQEGRSMVVDAAYLKRDERLALRALAAAAGADFSVVHCHAPEPVLRQRLLARVAHGADPSDATPEVMRRQVGYWQPPGDDERAGWVELCTDRPLQALQAACEAL